MITIIDDVHGIESQPKGSKNKLQFNSALTGPPQTGFQLKWVQIYSPLKLISLIYFVGNNRSPLITEEKSWSSEIR